MAVKYKVIIVDDEYLVRTGLRQTVDWQSLCAEVVAECENGAQALDAVIKHGPDLIISDVRMPVMDGLMLAEKLAERGYDGAVIFYSGYSDFEYVRKALEYGVSGYVLKPVENKMLVEKVAETMAALEEKRKKRDALASLTSGASRVRETYFSKLEEGVDDKPLKDQLEVLDITVPADGIVIYGRRLNAQDGKFSAVYVGLARALENFGATGWLWDDRFITVTGLTDREALCARAGDLLDEIYPDGVCAAIGISPVYGKGVMIYEAALKAVGYASAVIPMGGVYTEKAYFHGEGKKRNRFISDVLEYIYGHYAEKLTVKSVAEKLYVSESHLMHEMKEELGTTFNECLKQFRIQRAKTLLKQGGMRVSEVASAVGFTDVRYFGQVFKESTGLTPSEYSDEDEK